MGQGMVTEKTNFQYTTTTVSAEPPKNEPLEIRPEHSTTSSQEPTSAQQSPQPTCLTSSSEPTTHPQPQTWHNTSLAQQQSSPNPSQHINPPKQDSVMPKEQNRVDTTAVAIAPAPQEKQQPPSLLAPTATKEKGHSNRKQQQQPLRPNKVADTREQDNSSNNNTPTNSNNDNNNNGTGTATPAPSPPTTTTEKPSVGSEEWHRLRRENHKQVERRRRETINEGINEIAKMIPGNEKNKGQILHRAAVHIRTLKEQQAAALEKWTLEKLLTDQAMNELSRQVDGLKAELDQTRKENDELKRRLGINDDDGDDDAAATEDNRAAKRMKPQVVPEPN